MTTCPNETLNVTDSQDQRLPLGFHNSNNNSISGTISWIGKLYGGRLRDREYYVCLRCRTAFEERRFVGVAREICPACSQPAKEHVVFKLFAPQSPLATRDCALPGPDTLSDRQREALGGPR